MTSAIMLSFVIPALVAITLTVLLIQERDYLFNNKHTNKIQQSESIRKDHYLENKHENHQNDRSYIDFSGGMMGF